MKQILNGIIISNYIDRALNVFTFNVVPEMSSGKVTNKLIKRRQYWFQFEDGSEWLLARPDHGLRGLQYDRCIILPDVTQNQIENHDIARRITNDGQIENSGGI